MKNRRMPRCLLLLLLPAFGSVGMAQATFTAPSGFDTKPGKYYAYHPALGLRHTYHSNVRFQLQDDDMPKGKMVLKRMEWRTATGLSYSPSSNGMAIRFTRLTLQLGNGRSGQLTRTFSKNWNGAPTVVFRAAWSKPTISGRPKQVWGNAGSFPFSSNFTWDSSRGRLLQDWAHDGCILNAPPGYPPHVAPVLHLDTLAPPRFSYAPHYTNLLSLPLGPRRTGNICRDSGYSGSSPYSAYTVASGAVYSDKYVTQSVRGRGELSVSAYYVAPGGSLISIASLGGSDQGVSAGFRCNKIHVDPRVPIWIGTGTASTGTSGFKRWTSGLFTWRDAWAGNTIYFQTAWNDSKTKAPSVTVAAKLLLPKKPDGRPPAGIAEYVFSYLYGSPPTRRRGPEGPYYDHLLDPIERWTKR